MYLFCLLRHYDLCIIRGRYIISGFDAGNSCRHILVMLFIFHLYFQNSQYFIMAMPLNMMVTMLYVITYIILVILPN